MQFSTSDSELLRARMLRDQGITALRKGDTGVARGLLIQALQHDPMNEYAWLWLSATLAKKQERAYCLGRVLALNPQNEAARLGIAKLAGVLPSAPAFVAASALMPRAPADQQADIPPDEQPASSTAGTPPGRTQNLEEAAYRPPPATPTADSSSGEQPATSQQADSLAGRPAGSIPLEQPATSQKTDSAAGATDLLRELLAELPPANPVAGQEPGTSPEIRFPSSIKREALPTSETEPPAPPPTTPSLPTPELQPPTPPLPMPPLPMPPLPTEQQPPAPPPTTPPLPTPAPATTGAAPPRSPLPAPSAAPETKPAARPDLLEAWRAPLPSQAPAAQPRSAPPEPVTSPGSSRVAPVALRPAPSSQRPAAPRPPYQRRARQQEWEQEQATADQQATGGRRWWLLLPPLLLLALLTLLGLGPSAWARPLVCRAEDYHAQVAPLLQEWREAVQLIRRAPRFGLPDEITQLQSLRWRVADVPAPECAAGTRRRMLDIMNENVGLYLDFMARRPAEPGALSCDDTVRCLESLRGYFIFMLETPANASPPMPDPSPHALDDVEVDLLRLRRSSALGADL